MHVLVRSGGESLAVPVSRVAEVDRLGEVAAVPGAPAGVMGVRTLRGRVVPVIDLALLLGIAGGEAPRQVVIAHDGDRRAGLAVDEVLDVVAIDGPLAPEPGGLLAGSALAGGRLVGVVDVGRLLDRLAGA